MTVYKILYYDTGWNVHAVDVLAESLECAIAHLIDASICTRDDVITYYPNYPEEITT